ncbi:MAG: FAD-dependent oxidoreductase [Deltaproteobacteria bacterium]|nr:FAD-dependent oxidoreductase [Deltaproteobacteria bacterium]
METLKYEELIAPGEIKDFPVSMTTTEANLTGNWKFFRPRTRRLTAPCRQACPLGVEVAAYVQPLVRGDLDAALAALRRDNPLPAVTGRVCPRFCQQQCNRRQFDQPVMIGSLERFLGDYGLDVPLPAPSVRLASRVAVVGSGPAGLAAAAFLARDGIRVSVYERRPAPGGLLRYGIPAYRLPKDILDREIDNLVCSLGIEMRLGEEVDAAYLERLLAAYDFVFWAPGLGQAVIPTPFAGQLGVYGALELLADLAVDEAPPPGESFAVIGGGNAAIDAARSLRRHGRQVEIIYRRTREEMPAYEDERRQALEEGVVIRERRLVTGLTTRQNGRLLLELSESRAGADRTVMPGAPAGQLEVDGVVVAVGQQPRWTPPAHERLLTGGDFAGGPATVAAALASGRRAAAEIERRLGLALTEDSGAASSEAVVDFADLHLDYCPPRPALVVPELPAAERLAGFAEVCPPVDKEELIAEAERCFSCGYCTACGVCWFFCPDLAISIDESEPQNPVLIDLDHCKGCGLCAASCPRAVITMEEEK